MSNTDSSSNSTPDSASSTPGGQPTAVPTVPNEANAIRQAAQRFAPQWATYSSGESAADFAKHLPVLAPGAEASITKAAQDSWSSRFTKNSAFIGTLSGAVPIVDSYDPTKGTARVSVSVDQEAVGSEDAQKISPVTYHVDLVRYTDSTGVPQWGVTGATSA
ncbi:hypothetical protein GCM10025867_46800 (plasmid) [Frondihabitans sucicola]|uniref:Uncharacterized protein n=1 Tax=Frondihabitans sucicola TaxID=1268041 RepID=A0ABM8GVG8_9MICO|nr:hypothetical protein [Frondihabitans sucicola]BDZ52439.1 hypothetical protein GCM10025867_46800 [Frondihabitans sucicola]